MAIVRRHRRNCNEVGDAHELTFCCYQRRPFLKSERTCRWLAESIVRARSELEFDVWAYVFMPDHVHLIAYPRRPNYDIAEIRKQIKHPTSKAALVWLREHHPEWLPKLTRLRGKRTETLFWQSGGGYDRNIQHSQTLMQMIDYIHLNPVRKGLVERPEDWLWSSAGHFLKSSSSPLPLDVISSQWLDS
jgi:putative transposase